MQIDDPTLCAPAEPRAALPRAARPGVREELWLLGQPPLTDHLDFVRHCVDGAETIPPRQTIDAWRAANDHYAALERREAGYVEGARVRPLPAQLQAAGAEILAHPRTRATFDQLPIELGLVELDRLIVSQPHVTLPFVDDLAARAPARDDLAGLLGFCQPLDRTDPPVAIRRLSPNRYTFTSPSTDLRVHEDLVLDATRLADWPTFGPIAGAIGVMVGFGANLLSVIRSDKRLLLQNGYHRAVALRRAGHTHAAAILQTVTRRDELAVIASDTVTSDPAFYFAAARPPVLKDFFDPKIATVLPVRRMEKVVEVSIDVKEYDLPAA